MKNTDIFDVLVVYTSTIAISASQKKQLYTAPFPADSQYRECNDSYGYFLEQCQKNGLTVAFTTSVDVIGAGKAESYWEYKNKKWNAVNRNCYAEQIFEKFQPVNKLQVHKRELLFSSPSIKPFTEPYVFNLFSDKQLTYDTFSKHAIPTVTIADNSFESIDLALDELNTIIESHPHKHDFLQKWIMKDRVGSAGNNVYKIDTNAHEEIAHIMNKTKDVTFIIQPFIAFNNGYRYKDTEGFTEIRLLYHGNKMVQTYMRVSQPDGFICNETDGTIELTRADIPQTVLKTAQKINRILNKRHEIYALDFIVSNNGNVYLLEANNSPGIDWYSQRPGNVAMNKKMINIITKELARRVNTSHDKVDLTIPLIDHSTESSYKLKKLLV